MQKLQELRGRRDTIAASARQLHADHKDKAWDNAAGEQYDQLIAELNDIDAAIGREQAALNLLADETVDAKINEAKEKRVRNAGRDLFAKWLKDGDKGMTAQDWADIRATMSTTTSSQGGYTVPTEVYGAVLDVLKAYGGVREVATVIETESGNPINYPTSDGTSETGELIAENTTATGADPSFGVVTLSTYKFSSKIVAIPFELLQDAAVDMEAFIAKRLGERFDECRLPRAKLPRKRDEGRTVRTRREAAKHLPRHVFELLERRYIPFHAPIVPRVSCKKNASQ